MRDYEDIVGHRKRSVLPEAFQLSLVRLCRSLGDGRAPEQDVRAVISALSQLPPESYLRAGREIANIGRLYDWYEFKRPMRRWRALSLVHPTQPDNDLLSCTAGLEFLYLFHGNGFLRERALAKIAPPL